MILNTFKKYFVVISLFVLPLLIANQYYIDDMGRASIGYTKWGVDGRPIADIVMSILNLSTRMVDLAPLPLLLSVALLAISLSLYRKEFIGANKWGFLIPLAFLANPAIISMFSYRFDVFTFTFAISVAIVLFVVKVKNYILEMFLGSFFVIVVMGTYQAVINLVAILTICEIVRSLSTYTSPIDVIKKAFLRVLQVAIGGVVYAKIILPSTFRGGHSTNHPGISQDVAFNLKHNAEAYFNFASKYFYRNNGEVILILSAALCVLLTAGLAFNYSRRNNNSALALLVSSGAVIASALAMPMTMGALLLLEKPLGGVHLYMSVSGFYLLLATLLYYCTPKLRQMSVVVCIPLFYAFTMMYAYGNALRAQEKINSSVLTDIQQAMNINGVDVRTIIFNGESPKADIVKNAAINYPILKYTVIDYFWNWYWGSVYLSVNGINQSYISATKSRNYIENYCKFDRVYSSINFNAYYSEQIMVVDFSKASCVK
ncbi:glucosyltransferase domain-containing protein [Enterobacter cancerogenus]|uniref:glucosyltransferase domain-containing protein n=1 Tax=Enterobacter cancerogenus TaxID=69218 RepID=UPI0028B2B31A|nr:glucosyltransferase domain-containing protein [Enterobacter cancerogenus]MDT7012024.1 glucosyltransferase domain-containing protein [Enterobacter cancerogenus]WNN55062.1 glucosyltransferase domain-containing protein [Enterobacter cancerogenus]